MIRFSHEDGWSGGQWQFDGLTLSQFKKLHGIDPFPRKGMRAEIFGPAGTLPVICSERTLKVRGVDHDHGHQYPWRYNEPMFLIGNCPIPVAASTIWEEGYTIMLEVE